MVLEPGEMKSRILIWTYWSWYEIRAEAREKRHPETPLAIICAGVFFTGLKSLLFQVPRLSYITGPDTSLGGGVRPTSLFPERRGFLSPRFLQAALRDDSVIMPGDRHLDLTRPSHIGCRRVVRDVIAA